MANLTARAYRRRISEVAGKIRDKATELGFQINPDARISDISIAEQQRAEILKVLVGGARILILDEPTAVLTDEESESLLEKNPRFRPPGERGHSGDTQNERRVPLRRSGNGDASGPHGAHADTRGCDG